MQGAFCVPGEKSPINPSLPVPIAPSKPDGAPRTFPSRSGSAPRRNPTPRLHDSPVNRKQLLQARVLVPKRLQPLALATSMQPYFDCQRQKARSAMPCGRQTAITVCLPALASFRMPMECPCAFTSGGVHSFRGLSFEGKVTGVLFVADFCLVDFVPVCRPKVLRVTPR